MHDLQGVCVTRPTISAAARLEVHLEMHMTVHVSSLSVRGIVQEVLYHGY